MDQMADGKEDAAARNAMQMQSKRQAAGAVLFLLIDDPSTR